MLYLHKLDRDHEGLLGIWPVQLPGSVANLGKAGGQIHGRSAVLGQFTQGYQLGKERRFRQEGWERSGQAKLCATTMEHRAEWRLQGGQKEARLSPLSLQPVGHPRLREAPLCCRISGGHILHPAGLTECPGEMFRDIMASISQEVPAGKTTTPSQPRARLYRVHLYGTLHPLQSNAVSLLQPGGDGWLEPAVETIQGQDFMAGESKEACLACRRHGLASGPSPYQLTLFPPAWLKPTFKPLVAHLSVGPGLNWQSSFRPTYS